MFNIIYTTAFIASILLAACSPQSIDKQQRSAGGSNVGSVVTLGLPDKTKISKGPVERLTGYHLIINAIPEGCEDFENINRIAKWEETKISQKILYGCDYDIMLSVGELNTESGSDSLAVAFFSNEKAAAADKQLKKEAIEGKATVSKDLFLSLTAEGKAAGFGSGGITTNGGQNNNGGQNGGDATGLTEIEPDVDWHNIFDGISWRISNGYIETEGGNKPMGSTSLVEPCLNEYGGSFKKWGDDQLVKVAQLYATAITESGCKNLSGSSDNLSAGIMQVTGSTGNSLLSKIGREFSSSEECKEAMINDPELSIELAARYIGDSGQVSKTQFDPIAGQQSKKGPALDPPKVSAGYNAGSLRESSSNDWHLVTTGNHIDRYVAAYNAYVAYAKKDTSSISLLLYDKQLKIQANNSLPVAVSDIEKLSSYNNIANDGDSIFVGNFATKNGDFYYFINGSWRASSENW